MKRLFYITVFAVIPLLAFAEEHLIVITANGVRSEYLLNTLGKVVLDDKYSQNPLFNVHLTNGQIIKKVRTVAFDLWSESKDVEVVTSDSTATFHWPVVPEAVRYELIIYKDTSTGERMCTLTFDAEGHLIGIDFSPYPQQRTSLTSLSFTVTGMEKDREYIYSMTAVDTNGEVLAEDNGTFRTGEATDAVQITQDAPKIYTIGKTIVVECATESDITFHSMAGQQLGETVRATKCECQVSIPGVYNVTVGDYKQKVVVPSF